MQHFVPQLFMIVISVQDVGYNDNDDDNDNDDSSLIYWHVSFISS
jgi:hypothetical protein